jgi:hypothetical protein
MIIYDKVILWFGVIGKQLDDLIILPENMYNMDEIGRLLSVLTFIKVLVGTNDLRTDRSAILRRLEPPKMLPSFLRGGSGPLDRFRVTRAIRELHSLSLISYDGKGDTISLHPLVHAWARDALTNQDRFGHVLRSIPYWSRSRCLLELAMSPMEVFTKLSYHILTRVSLTHGDPLPASVDTITQLQVHLSGCFGQLHC